MPDSDVAVANEALTLIGDDSITSLDQDAARAKAIKRIYTPRLDAVLRGHDWNFARMRKALGKLDAVPEFGFKFMYQLPQDPLCLRVLTTNLDEDDPWDIEVYKTDSAQYRVLLTDETDPEIRYIARIVDPTLWDALFADAFVLTLASSVAYALTRNATLTAELNRDRDEAWKKARSVDGQEGRPLKRFLSNSFTSVR